MKHLMLKSAIASLVLLSTATLAQPPQQVLVYLTSENTQTQGMAMVLSTQMQKQNAKLHILLCDEAADLALVNNTSDKLKPFDKSPAELLDTLLQQGATVEVCALYLPNKNGDKTLKPGVNAAKPAVIAEKLLSENVKTFSF